MFGSGIQPGNWKHNLPALGAEAIFVTLGPHHLANQADNSNPGDSGRKLGICDGLDMFPIPGAAPVAGRPALWVGWLFFSPCAKA